MIKQFCPIEQGGAGDVGSVQFCQERVGRPLLHFCAHYLAAQIRIFPSRQRRAEALIFNQIFPPERFTDAFPFLVGNDADGDVTVGGFINKVNRREGFANVDLLIREGQTTHAFRPQKRDGGFQHGQPDVLTLSGTLPMKQRRRDSLRGREGGHLVGQDDAKHVGATRFSICLNVGCTGEALNDRIVNPFVGIGAAFPEATDGHENDAGIDLTHGFFAESHAFDRAGPEVLQQHICAFDKTPEHLFAPI